MSTPKGKHAWTATVGEKGQIVIPKQAREIPAFSFDSFAVCAYSKRKS